MCVFLCALSKDHRIFAAYTCISTISELKSSGGMEPESWFLLKWLQTQKLVILCAIPI